MASMTVRSTFAFDPTTARRLERLAARWRTSKSEVLRRVLEAAERESRSSEEPSAPATPLEAFRRLQSGEWLAAGTGRRWQREIERDRSKEA